MTNTTDEDDEDEDEDEDDDDDDVDLDVDEEENDDDDDGDGDDGDHGDQDRQNNQDDGNAIMMAHPLNIWIIMVPVTVVQSMAFLEGLQLLLLLQRLWRHDIKFHELLGFCDF